jgi:hypothetical protein
VLYAKITKNLETAVTKENQDLEDVKALLKAVSIAGFIPFFRTLTDVCAIILTSHQWSQLYRPVGDYWAIRMAHFSFRDQGEPECYRKSGVGKLGYWLIQCPQMDHKIDLVIALMKLALLRTRGNGTHVFSPFSFNMNPFS